jgi:hypothetical protein
MRKISSVTIRIAEYGYVLDWYDGKFRNKLVNTREELIAKLYELL